MRGTNYQTELREQTGFCAVFFMRDGPRFGEGSASAGLSVGEHAELSV